MEILVSKTDTSSAPATLFSRTLVVNARIVLEIKNENLSYSIADVSAPYERNLPPLDTEYGFDDTAPVVFLATVNGKPAGRIRMLAWWNRFAYVDDLAVNPEFRGRGIGRALLERGIQWARENNYPGVMLETQDDNVPACTLYQSCGFVLSGFDRSVYKAVKENPETALYWYLLW